MDMMLILYRKWKLCVVRDTNKAAKQLECDLKYNNLKKETNRVFWLFNS